MSLGSYVRWQRGVMTRAGFAYEEPLQWRRDEETGSLPAWVAWVAWLAFLVVVAGLVVGAMLSPPSDRAHCVQPPGAWRSICTTR